MTALLITLATLALLALALRHKLRRDAIHQDGVQVGSALLGGPGQSKEPDAYFVVIRGEPAFKEDQPFQHREETYLILFYASMDASSTVLRRFFEATCRVVSPGGGSDIASGNR